MDFSILLVQDSAFFVLSSCRLLDVTICISWCPLLLSFWWSVYSIHCLSPPFSTISRRFIIRARVGEDILNFSGLLIALVTLDALCWIMYVMVALMVSMSSSSCIVLNRFLNSSWNSIFINPIRVASTLGGLLVISFFPFYLYAQLGVAHNHSVVTSNVDLVDDCYVWPVC